MVFGKMAEGRHCGYGTAERVPFTVQALPCYHPSAPSTVRLVSIAVVSRPRWSECPLLCRCYLVITPSPFIVQASGTVRGGTNGALRRMRKDDRNATVS